MSHYFYGEDKYIKIADMDRKPQIPCERQGLLVETFHRQIKIGIFDSLSM